MRCASWPTGPSLYFFDPARARPGRTGEPAEVTTDAPRSFATATNGPETAVSPRRRSLAHRDSANGPTCSSSRRSTPTRWRSSRCGLSDNFLSCIFRAWDFAKPVILAPAMNTLMWDSPVTLRHLRQLLEDRDQPGAIPPAGRSTRPPRFSRGMRPGIILSRRKPSAWPAATSASARWPRSPRSPRWFGSGRAKPWRATVGELCCADRQARARLSRRFPG